MTPTKEPELITVRADVFEQILRALSRAEIALSAAYKDSSAAMACRNALEAAGVRQ